MDKLSPPHDRPLSGATAPRCAAPVGAGQPKGLLALLLAGGLLQRQGHRIELLPGENYPQAVRRVLRALPGEQREALRQAVAFLLTTDLRFGPFSALAKHQRLSAHHQVEPAIAGEEGEHVAADRRRPHGESQDEH